MGIKVTRVSKPLLISSIILLVIGSSLGSLSMMMLTGIIIIEYDIIGLHKTIQLEWFLTLLIMGIGYMLIPRFRNLPDPSPYKVYIPFMLLLTSIIFYLTNLEVIYNISMLASVSIFSTYVISTCRIKPKLLREADYYIILGIVVLLTINIIRPFITQSLQYFQFALLFPIMMILGVEYKTLPSFIGYINPRLSYTKASLILAIAVVSIGIISLLRSEIAVLFSIALLAMITLFDKGVYATHGFNFNSIRRRLYGEELARYNYTILYIRLSYTFLYSAIILSIIYHILPSFPLYDLSIHLLAIGFIGVTIKLYLPIMLPPIIGRSIRFSRFNLIPLYLLLIGIGLRIVGIANMNNNLFYLFGYSGWMIVASLLYYLIMIHRSMDNKI